MDTQRHLGYMERPREDTGRSSHFQAKQTGPEMAGETNLACSLMLDFQRPVLGENHFVAYVTQAATVG